MPLRNYLKSLFLSGLTSSLLAGCSHSEADPRTGPQLVRAATVANATSGNRDFTGVVSARVQSDLGFRVPGKVVARLVDTGQLVRRGQVLMRIDPVDLALATTAQQGVVVAARARATQTAADERRYRGLVAGGAVSASAYDQIKASSDAARAELAAAEAQAGVSRNAAAYSVLRADADGVVVETLAEPGQVVTAGQTVVRLAHAGSREAVVSLPETIRPQIGSRATAKIFQSGQEVEARLRQLSNSADPQSRTFEARYVLYGAAAQSPLGATVTVEVPDLQESAGMRVPLAAIYDVGKGPGVWLIGGQPAKVAWHPVRLIAVDEEMATVAGLKPGQRFVALGAHLLHEGETVRFDGSSTASTKQ